tara:strand:+ start:227 stop:970 length:744 start_codon:yes stop_codon:yes gene_type:complete
MHKFLNILLVIILLTACSNNNSTNETKLSSLIKADFSYTQDLFDCTLNENKSLISLESFFSKNIEEYKKIAELESLNISIFFPENNADISTFIISIISNNNPLGLKKFIDAVKSDAISEIASCSFAIFQNKGINLKEELINNNISFINAEILRCKYNDTYNFGTFQISINRFINNLRTVELPYSISYLEDNSKNDSFIWINYFYTEDYEDILLDNWANKEESAEIQSEFSTNATCIDSKKYKSYKLI